MTKPLPPAPPPPAKRPSPPSPVRPRPKAPPLALEPAAALTDQQLLELLGFELREVLPPRGSTRRMVVRGESGRDQLLTRFDESKPQFERKLFLAGARLMQQHRGRRDILAVHAVHEEHAAYLSDLWTVGNCSDLPALRWTLEEKLAFIHAVGAALQALHESGLIHGCLCPSNILLNDDLKPVLTEAGVVSVAELSRLDTLADEYRAFSAPEVLKGIVLEPSVDQYSLAQLAHFLLLDRMPQVEPTPVQKLEALSAIAPESVVRVIRKATMKSPGARYGTLREFLADLKEHQKHPVGASLEPGAPRSQSPAKARSVANLRKTGKPPGPVGPTQSRQRALWFLLVLILLVAGGAAAALLLP